ncbi:MAG TPA: hypothetical protein VFF27_12840 [Bacteroidia bacterium]|jgi:hypothetical protein|nr:hypothetical protein [Bacteroidia bacterium]
MKLKRISILIALLIIATFQIGRAQEQEKDKGFDTEKKGTTAIDVYYGFPNLFYLIFIAERDAQKEHFKNVGPFGVRAEYFVTDHIGFGVDVNYSISTVSWQGYEIDSFGHTTGRMVPYDITFTRLRALGKFNYHFGPTENFDMYAGAGLGINQTKFMMHENGVSRPYTTSLFFLDIASAIPLSWRLDFGGRYYFTKNIGAGFEVGIAGGPFASFSFCTKF